MKIERAVFNPRQLIETCELSCLAPVAARKNLELKTEVDAEVPRRLVSDAGRLRQVLINLGGNAIKFTDNGVVVIRLAPAEVGSQILWDLLRGGPPARVFRRNSRARFSSLFVQGDSVRRAAMAAPVLGLAISRRLVELMGGSLSVVSRPREGSRFVARLPMKAEAARHVETVSRTESHQGASRRGHPLKILVAEDDAINLKLTLTLRASWVIGRCRPRNGREAVEQFSPGAAELHSHGSANAGNGRYRGHHGHPRDGANLWPPPRFTSLP